MNVNVPDSSNAPAAVTTKHAVFFLQTKEGQNVLLFKRVGGLEVVKLGQYDTSWGTTLTLALPTPPPCCSLIA